MMRITEQLLPYNDRLPARDPQSVELIVLHSTELPDMKLAREFGERVLYKDGTGNCGHYYLDRDGAIFRFAEEKRIARHVRGHNERSIGIELVNSGRYPNWYFADAQIVSEAYSPAQLESLKMLLTDLKRRYPALMELARHSDLDTEMIPAEDRPEVEIRRKIDPGPMFPWDDILSFWQHL